MEIRTNPRKSAPTTSLAASRTGAADRAVPEPTEKELGAVRSLFHELMPHDQVSRSALLKLENAKFERKPVDLGFYISLIVCTRVLKDVMGMASVNHEMFATMNSYAYEFTCRTAATRYDDDPKPLRNARGATLAKAGTCGDQAYCAYIGVAARFREISEKYPCLVPYLETVMLVVDDNARPGADLADRDNHAYLLVGPPLEITDGQRTAADAGKDKERVMLDGFVGLPTLHSADVSKWNPTRIIETYDVRENPAAVEVAWLETLDALRNAEAPAPVRPARTAFDEDAVFKYGTKKKEPWRDLQSCREGTKIATYTCADLPEVDTDMWSANEAKFRVNAYLSTVHGEQASKEAKSEPAVQPESTARPRDVDALKAAEAKLKAARLHRDGAKRIFDTQPQNTLFRMHYAEALRAFRQAEKAYNDLNS